LSKDKTGGGVKPEKESTGVFECVVKGKKQPALVKGPETVLNEIQRQLQTINKVLSEAAISLRAPNESKNGPSVSTKRNAPVVRDAMLVSPLMQSWLNGQTERKVQLKGVEIQGKRILVAVPAPPHQKREGEKEAIAFERGLRRWPISRRHRRKRRSKFGCQSSKTRTGNWPRWSGTWNGSHLEQD
jgi:hypothetical protein